MKVFSGKNVVMDLCLMFLKARLEFWHNADRDTQTVCRALLVQLHRVYNSTFFSSLASPWHFCNHLYWPVNSAVLKEVKCPRKFVGGLSWWGLQDLPLCVTQLYSANSCGFKSYQLFQLGQDMLLASEDLRTWNAVSVQPPKLLQHLLPKLLLFCHCV